ncbi:MAG: hypothetical protein Q4C98_05565 [Capnocytophaga sp.]|nr:hypothetical protein [Capnocytophaga sp.]
MTHQNYPTQYGNLQWDNQTDIDETHWYCQTTYQSAVYGQKIEFSVSFFSQNDSINRSSLQFSEQILQNADVYLKKALDFLQKTFTSDPNTYHITPNELQMLQNPSESLFFCPAFSFYNDDLEWILRFDNGKLALCEPYGVAVFFMGEEVAFIDTLDDDETQSGHTVSFNN